MNFYQIIQRHIPEETEHAICIKKSISNRMKATGEILYMNPIKGHRGNK
jgi:hypothetical protein